MKIKYEHLKNDGKARYYTDTEFNVLRHQRERLRLRICDGLAVLGGGTASGGTFRTAADDQKGSV